MSLESAVAGGNEAAALLYQLGVDDFGSNLSEHSDMLLPGMSGGSIPRFSESYDFKPSEFSQTSQPAESRNRSVDFSMMGRMTRRKSILGM